MKQHTSTAVEEPVEGALERLEAAQQRLETARANLGKFRVAIFDGPQCDRASTMHRKADLEGEHERALLEFQSALTDWARHKQ